MNEERSVKRIHDADVKIGVCAETKIGDGILYLLSPSEKRRKIVSY